MVAHLWAHEQEESASGSNFFFEGTSIYSYGHHFEVGRIVKNKQGKKAYLINEDYYSATKGKHQRYVRNAIPIWAMVFSISDSPSNRYCLIGPIECNEKLIEVFKKGITVKLKYVEKRVLDTFTDNGIDLSNYTHCIIVKRNFYLAW